MTESKRGSAPVAELSLTPEQLEYLASPRAVRERSVKLFEKALSGGTHFKVDLAKLPEAARLTTEVTRRNYPDPTKIPFHARWEHFQASGVDRLKELEGLLSKLELAERARVMFDLGIVSVLLDAGAGADWKYRDREGRMTNRSEGLAVASFEMFLQGAFSSDPARPLQADARGLAAFTAQALARGFQVSDANPLVGLEGRAELIAKLGRSLQTRSEFFTTQANELRPGGLFDFYRKEAKGRALSAPAILHGLLFALRDMWPARVKINGIGFGDLWNYDLGGATPFENLVPFHKLSQWLSYTLIEALEKGGVKVEGSEQLTGLPEYRNGGLFLDLGVLVLRDPKLVHQSFEPGSALVIEWRGLTVALLDRMAEFVRADFGLSEAQMPLGKILQGGSWAAGRETARQLRKGEPPLKIVSDGTVF